MKKLITTILILVAVQGIAQRKTVTVSELRTGNNHLVKAMSINFDTGDTTKYIYVSFRNSKYKTIVDMESFMLSNAEEYNRFRKDIIFANSEKSTGSSMNWSRDNYAIMVYDFTNTVYLCSKSLRASTQLYKKDLSKMIDWLNNNEF